MHAKSLQSCPMKCDPPGFPVFGILQATILEKYWSGLLCPPPGDLSNPGIEPVSCLLRLLHEQVVLFFFFTISATWECSQKN